MSARKVYNSRWSEEEIHALIEARGAHDDDFKKKTSQYNIIWKTIQLSRAELLARTSQECSKKWNNLLDKFKQLKDPKTGTSSTVLNAANWIFFEKINDIMGNKDNIQPRTIISSINFSTDDDDMVENDPVAYGVDMVYDPVSVEYDPASDELEVSAAITEMPLSTSSSATTSTTTQQSTLRRKRNNQGLVDHFKLKDAKILKSINKNNKIIKKVVQKYFPEVDISSSESD